MPTLCKTQILWLAVTHSKDDAAAIFEPPPPSRTTPFSSPEQSQLLADLAKWSTPPQKQNSSSPLTALCSAAAAAAVAEFSSPPRRGHHADPTAASDGSSATSLATAPPPLPRQGGGFRAFSFKQWANTSSLMIQPRSDSMEEDAGFDPPHGFLIHTLNDHNAASSFSHWKTLLPFVQRSANALVLSLHPAALRALMPSLDTAEQTAAGLATSAVETPLARFFLNIFVPMVLGAPGTMCGCTQDLLILVPNERAKELIEVLITQCYEMNHLQKDDIVERLLIVPRSRWVVHVILPTDDAATLSSSKGTEFSNNAASSSSSSLWTAYGKYVFDWARLHARASTLEALERRRWASGILPGYAVDRAAGVLQATPTAVVSHDDNSVPVPSFTTAPHASVEHLSLAHSSARREPPLRVTVLAKYDNIGVALLQVLQGTLRVGDRLASASKPTLTASADDEVVCCPLETSSVVDDGRAKDGDHRRVLVEGVAPPREVCAMLETHDVWDSHRVRSIRAFLSNEELQEAPLMSVVGVQLIPGVAAVTDIRAELRVLPAKPTNSPYTALGVPVITKAAPTRRTLDPSCFFALISIGDILFTLPPPQQKQQKARDTHKDVLHDIDRTALMPYAVAGFSPVSLGEFSDVITHEDDKQSHVTFFGFGGKSQFLLTSQQQRTATATSPTPADLPAPPAAQKKVHQFQFQGVTQVLNPNDPPCWTTSSSAMFDDLLREDIGNDRAASTSDHAPLSHALALLPVRNTTHAASNLAEGILGLPWCMQDVRQRLVVVTFTRVRSKLVLHATVAASMELFQKQDGGAGRRSEETTTTTRWDMSDRIGAVKKLWGARLSEAVSRAIAASNAWQSIRSPCLFSDAAYLTLQVDPTTSSSSVIPSIAAEYQTLLQSLQQSRPVQRFRRFENVPCPFVDELLCNIAPAEAWLFPNAADSPNTTYATRRLGVVDHVKGRWVQEEDDKAGQVVVRPRCCTLLTMFGDLLRVEGQPFVPIINNNQRAAAPAEVITKRCFGTDSHGDDDELCGIRPIWRDLHAHLDHCMSIVSFAKLFPLTAAAQEKPWTIQPWLSARSTSLLDSYLVCAASQQVQQPSAVGLTTRRALRLGFDDPVPLKQKRAAVGSEPEPDVVNPWFVGEAAPMPFFNATHALGMRAAGKEFLEVHMRLERRYVQSLITSCFDCNPFAVNHRSAPPNNAGQEAAGRENNSTTIYRLNRDRWMDVTSLLRRRWRRVEATADALHKLLLPSVGASTLQYALRVQIANGLYQLSAACATESIPPSQTWRFDDNVLWGQQSVFCYFVKSPVFGNWWGKDNALAVSLAVVQRIEQTYDSSSARHDAEWLLNDVVRRFIVPMAPRYVLFALLSCDHLPTSVYATLLNGLFFSSNSTNYNRRGKVPEEENTTPQLLELWARRSLLPQDELLLQSLDLYDIIFAASPHIKPTANAGHLWYRRRAPALDFSDTLSYSVPITELRNAVGKELLAHFLVGHTFSFRFRFWLAQRLATIGRTGSLTHICDTMNLMDERLSRALHDSVTAGGIIRITTTTAAGEETVAAAAPSQDDEHEMAPLVAAMTAMVTNMETRYELLRRLWMRFAVGPRTTTSRVSVPVPCGRLLAATTTTRHAPSVTAPPTAADAGGAPALDAQFGSMCQLVVCVEKGELEAVDVLRRRSAHRQAALQDFLGAFLHTWRNHDLSSTTANSTSSTKKDRWMTLGTKCRQAEAAAAAASKADPALTVPAQRITVISFLQATALVDACGGRLPYFVVGLIQSFLR